MVIVNRVYQQAAVMEYVLDPDDEYTHTPTSAPNYNESVYVNGFDFDSGVGGWMRLGNRVNEGHAELAVCLYLADGRIACQFRRPEIRHNDAFEAGGFEFVVKEPHRSVEVDYEGELMLVDDPQLFRNPKELFENTPRVPSKLRWSCRAMSPMHGGVPADEHAETMYGRAFSLGHFYQHIELNGQLEIGDTRIAMQGFGWRDHSWGPRTWQNIRFHRLLTGTFVDGSGFCLLKIANQANAVRRYGVLLVDGEYEEVVDFDLLSDWDDFTEPVSHTLRVRSASRTIEIGGRISRLAPLRNNKREGASRLSIQICEGATRWSSGAKTGFGMTEFGDLIVDGRLAGFPL